MSAVLTLYFAGNELVRTCYDDSRTGGQRTCVRRRSSDSFGDPTNTFHWTPAVSAFCRLALLNAAWQLDRQSLRPTLKGGDGTAAAALDVALAKPPFWISNLLGADEGGKPLLVDAIERSVCRSAGNGGADLSFAERFLADTRIHICRDGRPLDRFEIEELESDLTPGNGERYPSVFSAARDRAWLAKLFADEIRRGTSADVFGPTGYRETLSRIYSDCSAARLTSEGKALSQALAEGAVSSGAIGATDYRAALVRSLERLGVFRIAAQVPCVAMLAVLRELARRFPGRFEVDHRYAHAVHVMDQVVRGEFYDPPHAIVLSLAPAATFVEDAPRYGYRAFSILPSLSFRAISKIGISSPTTGEFIFVGNGPTTSLMHYNVLESRRTIQSGGSRAVHANPHEIFTSLRNGIAERAIVSFPDYEFNVRLNDCAFTDGNPGQLQQKDFVLFLRDDCAADRRLTTSFERALRDSWRSIRTSEYAQEQMGRELAEDPDYVRTMCRFSGLTSLQGGI